MVLDRLLDTLRQRVREVETGRLSPKAVQEETHRLCASCRGLLAGITGLPSREELIQHLRLQIRRIEARLDAEEENREPSAEHPPRLTGPGDRAE